MMIPVGNMTKASVMLSIEIGLNDSCPSHETDFFLLVCNKNEAYLNELLLKWTTSKET